MKLECKLIGEGCEQLADLPENCKYFLWLINHESLSVGKWLQEEAKMALVGVATMIQNRLNIACWSYSYTNMIWERIIHILASCGMEGLISFGYAIWWSLQKMHGCVEHKTPPQSSQCTDTQLFSRPNLLATI